MNVGQYRVRATGDRIDNQDGDVRFVRKFAWFPTMDYVGGTWVWMESYVRREYFSDMDNTWREAHRLKLMFGRVVYDCRITEAR